MKLSDYMVNRLPEPVRSDAELSQNRSLRRGAESNKKEPLALCTFGNCLGVAVVILLPLHERLYIDCG
ncbi:MAG: hypothetical protein WBV83_12590, partial [Bradyrhizobium sp.]|uniref:hypothetical protein n=1 Tax=Bradyrhizobium sp. TaxID=376 RepID=UPI003C31ACAE